MAKKKKPTQVAFVPPAIGYPLIGAAGYITSKAVEKFMDKKGDDAKVKKDSPPKEIQLQEIDDAEVEKLQKMIDEETKKKRKGKQVKGTLTAKKGGLIKSKKKAVKKFRGDGIAKRGKTKGRMI
jgi:hypothetical protein